MRENRGHARCIATGLKYIFKKEEFDYVIPMDGDGEDRPEEIKQFIESIENAPNKTIVGEKGIRLSGGERQRIGIARALYRNPQVLILDEATSALDNLTESAVMKEIHKIGNKKTVILIAHRLTTLKECDIIFLLKNGKLEAQGTYDELIKSNGLDTLIV